MDAEGMSIRHWPEGERPREKLLSRGSAALSDAELLAVLLGSGVRGKDAIALGRELLMRAGSLGALLGRPDQEIRATGLGPAKRARIAAALELARRSLAEQLTDRPTLGNPRESGEYLSSRLRHLPYEVFACLYLDNRHRVLGFEELFRGTGNIRSMDIRFKSIYVRDRKCLELPRGQTHSLRLPLAPPGKGARRHKLGPSVGVGWRAMGPCHCPSSTVFATGFGRPLARG